MKKIDIHLNLAGVGTNDSNCFASHQFRRRYTFTFMKWMQGVTRGQMQTSVDVDWAKKLADLVTDSQVDYGVVLGFDDLYCPKNHKKQVDKTQMRVPMSWVLDVCKKNKNLLPGPGINPYRPDALEQLEEAARQGSVLIKWLPPAQNIQVDDPYLKSFYKKCVELEMPLLIHTGGERTFKSVLKNTENIGLLKFPLELGVKVIAAHAGTPVILSNEPKQFDLLVDMIKTFPNLWVDNSGLCNPGRFLNLKKLTEYQEIMDRTLYGSDWPVPVNSFYFPKTLGIKKIAELEKIKNLIDRDIAIKREFSYPEKSLTLAHQVLHLKNTTL